MDFLIGSITGLLLITLFRFFEKKRVDKLGKTSFLFLFYVVLCSSFMKPSEEFIGWLIFCLLLYSVLDDMKTKTLNIYFPIIATLLFFFFIEKPYFFLYSLFFFFIFLIFTKVTKEKIMGEGDSYLFLALSTLLLTNLPYDAWFMVAEQWVNALLLSVLGAAVVGLSLKLFHRNLSELAFGPFLVLGCVIVYSGSSWVMPLLSFLIITSLILYLVWVIKLVTSYLIEKKRMKNKTNEKNK